MRTREEVARFIEAQFDAFGDGTIRPKNRKWHYGKQEVRDLFDFIYDGAPTTKSDEVFPQIAKAKT
jgi:hypothetical protein